MPFEAIVLPESLLLGLLSKKFSEIEFINKLPSPVDTISDSELGPCCLTKSRKVSDLVLNFFKFLLNLSLSTA